MFLNRERRQPIALQSLNALDKLDADVNKLAEISRDGLSVSQHIRLLLVIALLSQALGLNIEAADLLLTPSSVRSYGDPPCLPLARLK
jgi:hypothetical protein